MQESTRRGPGRRAHGLGLAGLMVLATLAACGTAPTDSPAPPAAPPAFTGIAADAADHSVALRGLYVIDPGADGYKAGGRAALTVQLWNNTNTSISLTGAALGTTPLVLVGGAAASSTTYDIPVPGGGNVALSQATGRYLQIACLPANVPAGARLPMTFTFSNKVTITTAVPVGTFGPNGQAVPTSGAASC